MKVAAMTVAAAGFFVLALVGWVSRVPVFTCGMRALAGAAMLYVLVRLVGALLMWIVVEAAVKDKIRQANAKTGKEVS